MRWIAGGQKQHRIERQRDTTFLSRGQMPVMDRIECPAKNADTLPCHRASVSFAKVAGISCGAVTDSHRTLARQ